MDVQVAEQDDRRVRTANPCTPARVQHDPDTVMPEAASPALVGNGDQMSLDVPGVPDSDVEGWDSPGRADQPPPAQGVPTC